MTQAEQRRRFSRVRFQGSARLSIDDQEWPCELLDVSLKGALVGLEPTLVQAQPGARCLLELQLGDDGGTVRMEGELAYRHGALAGLACREIDLDSLTHLRRLLELNLGTAESMQRELSALIGR